VNEDLPGEPTDEDAGVDEVDAGDRLPDDLDITTLELPYVFPNNNRRRLPAVLYIATATVFIAVALLADGSPRVNSGFVVAGVCIAAFGVYSWVAGWNLDIDELDALAIAAKTVGFPVGHASAQLAWRGVLSRPTWRILVYSNEPQPEQRALVFVDGVDGAVLDQIVEANPEDFSEY